jgi:ribosomal protein S3AE
MQITKDFHHQDSNVMFKIIGTSGQTLKTKFLKFSTSLSSIKRNARRRRDRIDMRVEFKTKDDISAFIKVVLITQRNTTRLIRSQIQNVVKEYLKVVSNSKNFSLIANDIIRNKLQREMVPKVKKIYPVKSIIIREYGVKSGDIETDESKEVLDITTDNNQDNKVVNKVNENEVLPENTKEKVTESGNTENTKEEVKVKEKVTENGNTENTKEEVKVKEEVTKNGNSENTKDEVKVKEEVTESDNSENTKEEVKVKEEVAEIEDNESKKTTKKE